MHPKSPESSDQVQHSTGNSCEVDRTAAVCNICNRSYSRMEHLIRHLRSHTQEKPFTCSICHKSFARTDVLQRHYVNHLEGEPSDKRPRLVEPSQQRVSRACLACAETKVRCQGGNPCRRCLTKNIPCRPRPKTTYKQPGRDSRIRTLHSEEPEANNDIGSDHSQSTEQYPRDGLLATGEQTDRSITTSGSSTLGDYPIVGSSLQHAKQISSLTDAPIRFPVQMPLDDSYLFISPGVEPSPEHENSYITDFLMSVMLSTDTPGETAYPATSMQRPSPADVLDFTGASFHLSNSQLWSSPTQQTNKQINAVEVERNQDNNAPVRLNTCIPSSTQPQSGLVLGAQAFRNSMWSFDPSQKDQWKTRVAQLSSSAHCLDSAWVQHDARPDDVQIVTISSVVRNKMLSLLVSLSDHLSVDSTSSLLSLFPSPDLLTKLLNRFVAEHAKEIDTFIHIPTFNPEQEVPELILGMIASAALSSTLMPVHEFGCLLHEAHRELNARLHTNDNRNARLLAPMQSLALSTDCGLWSGDRRSMEVAEGLRNSLVTMLRRSQVFSAYNTPRVEPQSSDSACDIEEKWRSWVKYESLKRLGLHMLTTDVQCSMSLLIPPLISPTEMRLALPASADLWEAKTAEIWRCLYLAKSIPSRLSSLPSVRNCIQELGQVLPFKDVVDPHLTSLIILSGLWPSIFCFRQLAQLRSDGESYNSLIVRSLYQEAKDMQDAFRVVFSGWCDGLGPATLVLHERMLMSLHVSLEDVQLLGGKVGEIEARRVVPMLSAWTKRREARQALWHAGQLLRAAKTYPGSIPASSMIAVYHASLVLWAYSAALSIENLAVPNTAVFAHDIPVKLVCLDGDNDVQQFLTVGQGTPVVTLHDQSMDSQAAKYIPIRDGRAVMTSVVDFILTKNGAPDTRDCLPVVANLGRLMLELGYAAGKMSRECIALHTHDSSESRTVNSG